MTEENIRKNVVNKETLVPVGIVVSIILFLVSGSIYGAVKINNIENDVSNNTQDIEKIQEDVVSRTEFRLNNNSINEKLDRQDAKLNKLLEGLNLQ